MVPWMGSRKGYMVYTYMSLVMFLMAVKGRTLLLMCDGRSVHSSVNCYLSLGDHYNPNNSHHGGLLDKEKVKEYKVYSLQKINPF